MYSLQALTDLKLPCRLQRQQEQLLSLRLWKLRQPGRSRCPRRRRRGGPRRPQPMARSQVGQLRHISSSIQLCQSIWAMP